MRGYEITAFEEYEGGGWFRIPMRGYEGQVLTLTWQILDVPNPHEGL